MKTATISLTANSLLLALCLLGLNLHGATGVPLASKGTNAAAADNDKFVIVTAAGAVRQVPKTNAFANARLYGDTVADHITATNIAQPDAVYVFEGDSTTAGETWYRRFLTNSTFANGRLTALATNFAVSSDGVGYGHPEALGALSYRAISRLETDGDGLATATVSNYYGAVNVRTLMVRTATGGFTNRVLVSAPTYYTNAATTNCQFTFQTTKTNLSAVYDARYEWGAVSRYVDLVRPLKPTGSQQGYYFSYLGLNDQGAVYQGGDCSGLTNLWRPALSNLWKCARADGFKIVAFTIYGQTSTWTNGGANARALMNDTIRTLNENGKPMWDYLVDLEAAFRNPFDLRYIEDGLHPTANGYQLFANLVSSVLSSDSAGQHRPTANPELTEWCVYSGQRSPYGVIAAPVGSLYTAKGESAGNQLWLKSFDSTTDGWRRVPSFDPASPALSLAQLVVTNSYNLTNALSGTDLNVARPRWFYATNDAVSLSGVSGHDGTNDFASVLWLANTAASGAFTVTVPAAWRTPDGARTYYLTNAHRGCLTVEVFGNSMTNAAFKDLW